MKLSVEKITKNIEEEVKQKIQHYAMHAEICEANKNDIDCILDIYERAWHSTTMPFHPISKSKLSRLLKNKNYLVLLAKIDAIDVAFIIVQIRGEKNDIGVIGILAVIPELHHKGLGTMLGMACWDYLKKREIKELRCQVYSDNKPSCTFLRSLGFEEIYDNERSKYLYAF